MAKKALVSTVEPKGEDGRGYRVLEVVDATNTFEVSSELLWKDCDNSVETQLDWYDPITETFRPLPDKIHPETAGELATDSDGNFTEDYEWSYTTDTWTKIQILNQE